MKRTFAALTLLAGLGTGLIRADFNPVPLTPGSFTADVVVEAAAAKPLADYTTATMDGGTNNDSQVWFEQGFDVTRPTTGFPPAGNTFIAQTDLNRTFQMPPSYTANNALFLSTNGSATGTLTLTTPTAATVLSVLGSVSGGATTLNYTVNFQGGGTESGTVTISDWFNNAANIALTAAGRVNVSNGQTDNQYGTNPRLHFADIFLANTTTPITSVSFTTPLGSRTALFGISASTDFVTYTPVTVTGFNRDMVVEAGAPISSLYTKCNVIMDGGGTNLTGNTWYEIGFNKNAPATGIPAAGANVSGGSPLHTFTMAPSYTANNVVYIGNFAGYTTGTLTLTTPTAFTSLSFLNSAGNGPVSINVTVTHADTSTQVFNFNSLDWFNAATPIYTASGRFNPVSLALNNVGEANMKLFNNDITLANTTSPVTSIQFDYVSGGRAMIFAVAGQATAGGTFSPVAVTGYTADGVVEASAFRFPNPLYTSTTATMDGGTNFTGGNANLNTWYERGYYRNRPETGLPPAGSTITSFSLPDHHYQMPATYTGNNAIFVDSNSPVANLTIASPAAYSALSFLSTCANGGAGVTNQAIMQYADGTSETNTFISYDWFANLPYAFTASGRTDVNRRTVNAVGSTNPKLFEAQFALGNTTSPVTNVVLRFLSAASVNARLFVFAVSATAGSVPPIIASTTITPASTYEGSNVVFNAVITGGTEPISYQWQKGTNGVFVNVVNGGNISGATTTNMTIAATPNDIADYRLVASNVVGPVNGAVVTLQRVLSTLPDITAPGDLVNIFPGTTTPAAEGVANAINNNMAKYLNWDADAAAPFVGPVGFTVRPAIGNTIVTALRFYTANDSDGRDPADYILEGSLDGSSFTTISSGALALPTARNAVGDPATPVNPLTQNLQEVRFANTQGYAYYRVTFNNVRNNAGNTSMQIAEMEFLGVVNPNPPPTFTLSPVNVSANEGTTATFTSLATGPGPITYQWYNVTSGEPGTPIGGNSPNLSLPNVTPAQSGTSYRVVATNPYGSVTNPSPVLPAVTLTVNSGPIAVVQDLPAEAIFYAGRTLTLSVGVAGTSPSYQWQSNGVNLVNGGRISGATSSVLTIADAQVTDGAVYQLQSSNSFGGPIPSSPATVYVTAAPPLTQVAADNLSGLGWTLISLGNDLMYFLSPNELVLTTAGDQRRAVWFNTPMQIDGFKASFRYQDVTTGGADGFAFVVQNSPQGTNASGGGGGGLAYTGIPSSAAVMFNIYNTPGIAFGANGVGGPYTPTSVNFANGDIYQVDLNYNGSVLAVSLSNTVTAATYTTNMAVGSLANIVGTNVAYIGITAATGGIAAQQNISNFQFVPQPKAAATQVGNNLLITWSGLVGGYNVAGASAVTGPYTTIPGIAGQTNGLYQKLITAPVDNGFYRLQLSLP